MLNRSIRRKLPLLISLLLAGVVAAVSLAAYSSVERALLASLTRDLTTAAGQLVASLEESAKITRVGGRKFASDSAVLTFLSQGDASSKIQAEQLLEARRNRSSRRVGLAIWDRHRRPLISVGQDHSGARQLARGQFGADDGIASDSGVLLRLLACGDTISLGVLSAVFKPASDGSFTPDTVGFVAEYRSILGGSQVRLIRGLIGSEAHFALGSREGGVWTNLDRRVAGPPSTTPNGTLARITDPTGTARLGIMLPVAGTDWQVWVDMPESVVFGPARNVLQVILTIALAAIALGAFGAWLLSKGITGPLAEVALAAKGITAGDYSRRALVSRSDELGVLATSFNSMAARVEETTHSLERQAVELEYQFMQSQALAEELEVANKELTEALRSVEESADASAVAGRRYQRLVENATDLIAVVDAEGRFLYASPAHERVFGTPAEELIGQPSLDRVLPEDRPEVERRIAEAILHPGESVAARYRFQHADGTWRHIEAHGVNLLDDPAIGGIVVNARDVTAQQHLENQLLQAQKMEAVGRFAGGVAHDFNNILTAIKSYCQLALDELDESATVREDVLEIERAADRAAALTRQILAFSRQQVLRPRILDLNETIGGIENMLRRLMMTDVALETRLAADLGSVEADPGQIEQVLMNLVVNARDAMPEGGHITIATANGNGANSQPELEPHGFPPGPYVVLAVSDTGEGMSRETQEKIFEPFFTTKDQGKGTGLGLSTVYGIVKQSGGYICVYSEPGQGTTFKIFLPRADVTAEHRIPSLAGLARPGGPERILLVEDDKVLRSISRRVLTRVGYEVLEAENGCEALLMIDEHGNGISLVITDLIMPKMRGTELLSEIRKRHGWLPVLLVSGYTEDAMIRKGSIDADTNFLEKPFTPDVLVRAVRKILDGRNLFAGSAAGVGSRRVLPVS